MKSSHRLGGLFALGIVFTMIAAACSSADSESAADNGVECFYGCNDEGPGDRDAAFDDDIADGTSDAGGDPLPLHPLCGVGSCHPDFEESCTGSPLTIDQAEMSSGDDEPPAVEEDAGADANDEGESPAPPSPGDEPPPADEADAGADADAGEAKPDPPPSLGCHVRRGKSGPLRSCEPTGTGEASAPCIGSSDCAPGLACVGPRHGGVCRPYCCGDSESCPSQTFCEARGLRDDVESESPMAVPVCVPAMGCKLLEHEPCASLGLVCGIVRADGTTSCVLPGTGKLDEPCPCAFGYVCAKSSNKCLKLCHVSQAATECPGGTCQGGTEELPPGFGVCVGGFQDAG